MAAACGASFGTSAGEETELLRAGKTATPAAAAVAGVSYGQAQPSKQQQQRAAKASARHARRRQQQHKQHERQQQQQFVPLLRHFVCVASYGFLGDVMEASEKLRWMGPLR
jgi:hypothetical protein